MHRRRRLPRIRKIRLNRDVIEKKSHQVEIDPLLLKIPTHHVETSEKALVWQDLMHGVVQPSTRQSFGSAMVDGMLYLLGGISGSDGRTNSVERFHLATKSWEKVQVNGDIPSPRTGHSCIVAQNRLWIYGGEGDSHGMNARDCFGDLYTLDLTTHTWKRMHVMSSSRNESMKMVFLPAPRRGHSALYDQKRSQMIVFGGIGPDRVFGNDVFFNDVQILDLEHVSWHEMEIKGTSPSPRAQHAALYDENTCNVYVFGGLSTKIVSTVKSPRLSSPETRDPVFADDQMHALNVSTHQWQHISSTGEAPSPRYGHQMIQIASQLFLYGGRTKTEEKSKLHVFHTLSNRWSSVLLNDLSCVGRHFHTLKSVGTKGLLMYGGCGERGLSDNRVHLLTLSSELTKADDSIQTATKPTKPPKGIRQLFKHRRVSIEKVQCRLRS